MQDRRPDLPHGVPVRRCGSARRSATQTGMDQGKLSVASVAVDVAREVFDSFADKTVLVIGAGKMGELTLQHLKGLNPGTILVTNRSPERAEAAARALGRPRRAVRPARPGPDRGRPGHQHHRRQRADRHARAISAGPARPAEPAGLDPRHRHPSRLRPADRRPRPGDALPRRRPPRPGRAEPARSGRRGSTRRWRSSSARRPPATPCCGTSTTPGTCSASSATRYDADPPPRAGRALRRACPTSADADREAIAHMCMRLQNQFLHHPRAAVRSAVAEPHHDHPHPSSTPSATSSAWATGPRIRSRRSEG